jgi:hypothetical protein
MGQNSYENIRFSSPSSRQTSKDMAESGQGTDPSTRRLSPGMPRVTNGHTSLISLAPQALFISVR